MSFSSYFNFFPYPSKAICIFYLSPNLRRRSLGLYFFFWSSASKILICFYLIALPSILTPSPFHFLTAFFFIFFFVFCWYFESDCTNFPSSSNMSSRAGMKSTSTLQLITQIQLSWFWGFISLISISKTSGPNLT